MSFAINFMYQPNELNKIRKSPTTILSLEGTLRESTSIVDPEIMIEYNGTFTGINYAYIATFQRYYYVTDIISVANKLWTVKMHCDVLMTYADALLSTPCITSRQAKDWNLYLNDGQLQCTVKSHIMTKRFPSGFPATKSWVLALAGDNIEV